MVLDASLLNTQHYKVQIKDKVEQSRERSSTIFKFFGMMQPRIESRSPRP